MQDIACRPAEHGFGIAVGLGGRLLFRKCRRCSTVELDLRSTANNVGDYFDAGQRASWYSTEVNDTASALKFATGA